MRFCLHQTSRTIKTTLLSQPRAFVPHSIIIAQLSRTMVSESKSSQKPENLKTEEYKTDAKWLKLEKINWKDQDGKQVGLVLCLVMPLLTVMVYRGCGKLPIGRIGPSQESTVSFTLSTEPPFHLRTLGLDADHYCLAVHILALLFHPHKPVSTVIIEQYRPPVASTVIGRSIY